MDSILYNTAEVGMMTKMGGGTSGYFGEIRRRGTNFDWRHIRWCCNFMQLFDSVSHVCKQADVRRGKWRLTFLLSMEILKTFEH